MTFLRNAIAGYFSVFAQDDGFGQVHPYITHPAAREIGV